MTWKLYSSPRSPFVRKVMIAVHELGLQDMIERQDVTTTPMNPAPELLPANPLGMISTLIVNDQPIFDSLTIMRYLDAQAQGGLFAAPGEDYAMLTRHAMASGAMDKAVRILDEQFRTQNDDTAEHISGFVEAIRRAISWMEPRLSADRFDAADICFAALISYLEMRFPQHFWMDHAPAARAWYDEVAKRPSMQATAFAAPPFV